MIGFLDKILAVATAVFDVVKLSIQKKRENIYYIMFWIIACTPLLFDISLEMQIGITFFALFSSLILKQISISESNV